MCTNVRNLLATEPYRTLVVEVQDTLGIAPTPAALENLRNLLDLHLHKLGGIVVQQKFTPAPGKSS